MFKEVSNIWRKKKLDKLQCVRDNIESKVWQLTNSEIVAYKTFEINYIRFLNAKTVEEQIAAIKNLVASGFIERNSNNKKIYLNNLSIYYKQMTGYSGDTVSWYINELAAENNIIIPLRKKSADRAISDLSGKHNEAGVVAIIDASKTNINNYRKIRKRFKELAGDDSIAHERNIKAADIILQMILKNGAVEIITAKQVGGIGKNELLKLGINSKSDPTDIIVSTVDAIGNTRNYKISMKTYYNPNNITMKNSGVGKAGSYYLGDASIDLVYKDIAKKFNWRKNNLSTQEIIDAKKSFKDNYLKIFSDGMIKLSKSAKGQKRLIAIWNDIHGCGNNVYTSITNKSTGETVIYKPSHYEYCGKFKIIYDGTKILMYMVDNENENVKITCKTETKSSAILLFNHIVTTKKLGK